MRLVGFAQKDLVSLQKFMPFASNNTYLGQDLLPLWDIEDKSGHLARETVFMFSGKHDKLIWIQSLQLLCFKVFNQSLWLNT